VALQNLTPILIDLRGDDAAPAGRFGLVQFDFAYTAAYVDPQTDILYIVPYKSTYPMSSTDSVAISAPSNVIYSVATDTNSQRQAAWERDEILMRDPKAMRIAQSNSTASPVAPYTLTVTSFDSTNTQTAQGVFTVTNEYPFTMIPFIGRKYNVRFDLSFGTSAASEIETFTMAESEQSLYAPEQ
jgi:hypothetical protein